MKISIDFDGTLSRNDVQLLVSELISKGADIWITTARYLAFVNDECVSPKEGDLEKYHHTDILKVSKALNIPLEKITFVGSLFKIEFLKDKGFVAHLDDDKAELEAITEEVISPNPVLAVNVNEFDYAKILRNLVEE